MSLESLMATSLRLSSAVETLAVLGAELSLRQAAGRANSPIRTLMQDVIRSVDPQLLDGLDSHADTAALALIRTAFRQALDLLENPSPTPGWNYRDPLILQSHGQLSRLNVHSINAIAARQPKLGAALINPGTLLDVGTGVGWLAIEAARCWPVLRVVGIDPWEPALALARENLVGSGVGDRVEFRRQRVEHFDELGTFSLAWLPGPFITADIADRALRRIYRALSPGGWLIFGLNQPPAAAPDLALSRLRAARIGGHPWTVGEAETRLRANRFEQVETFSPPIPIRYVIGRRL